MLALGDHMVWATVYGVLGLGLPQSVTHSVWCLRMGPSTECDPWCMVPQGPATVAYSAASGAAPQAPETTEGSSPFHFAKCAANQFCCLGG